MRSHRTTIIAVVAFLCCVSAGVVPVVSQSKDLERLLLGEVARVPARVGVYVKNLNTGDEVAIRADEMFNSQSIRKIPIMILAFQSAEEGKLNLSERMEIRRSDFRTGTGVLQYHDPGTSVTVRDLITEMIITSDNTATGMVMGKLGGRDRINQWLSNNKYVTRTTWGNIEGSRRMFESLGPPFLNLTDEEITGLEYLRSNNPVFDRYSDLFRGDRTSLVDGVAQNAEKLRDSLQGRRSDDENYWTGRTSPREIAKFLESIERGTAVSAKRSTEMKNILLQQQLGVRRIPHYLTVPVAHKTGDGRDVANDAGIVYARSGPIVISLFTMGITGPYAETEDQIGRISRMIVDYFDSARKF
jgi:beta-lactamase class A